MSRLLGRQAQEKERRDELLSAYLDGELSAGERARLEARLATDPALRAELEALRRTVALVRDLPTVPVPRNFILPRTMAARARPRPVPTARSRLSRMAPFLTAATAVVSFLFVVVLAGDLLLSGAGGEALKSAPIPMAELPPEEAAPRAASPPSPVGVEVTREVEVEQSEAELPAPIASQPQAMVVTATTEVALSDFTTPTDAGEEARSFAATPSPPVLMAERAIVTPTRAALATEATEVPAPEEIAPAPTTDQTDEPLSTREEESVWMPEGEAADLAAPSPWRALEIALGLTALGLGLVTIRAWRARRRHG